MYVVVLDATLHGSSVMTTDDVIEADLPADAEAKAIEQWTRTEQRFRFQPLLTMLQPDGDRGAWSGPHERTLREPQASVSDNNGPRQAHAEGHPKAFASRC